MRQKICPSCGGKLDEYIYVFRPDRAQEITDGIKAKFPSIDFTIDTIEGQKIKIILKQFLTQGQKVIMNNYFTNKGYIEDIETENIEKS